MEKKDFKSRVKKEYKKETFGTIEDIYGIEYNRFLETMYKVPDSIIDFIKFFLSENKPRSIVSFWSGISETEQFLLPILNHFKPNRVTAHAQLRRLFYVKPENYDKLYRIKEIDGKKKKIRLPIEYNFENYEEAYKSLFIN